jgi:hypothetical protein
MFVLKAIAAVCLGFALFSALQAVGVRALQEYIKSGNANAGLPVMNRPVVTSFDADALKNILPKYGPIDTTEGQRLAVEGAARRIDLQIRNAQSYMPVPGRFGRSELLT